MVRRQIFSENGRKRGRPIYATMIYVQFFLEGVKMNILFFLTPKEEVSYIETTDTLRGAIEKLEYHGYTAVPILDEKGRYVGTLTEGDLLRVIKKEYDLTLRNAEDIPITDVPRRWKLDPVNINAEMDDLLKTATQQNFVPVVDDNGVFIGIITRKTLIQYMLDTYRKQEKDGGKDPHQPENKRVMVDM
jgi:CBS domain-containing protein